MGNVKEINIKNQTYYFFDDIINIKNFQSNLLKIDKKPHEDINCNFNWNVTNITIKKFSDCENVHSVNPLYLIINSGNGYFKEKLVKNS